MPVPEEHYGKGVPVVLNLSLRLVEFPGDFTGGLCYFLYHQFFVQLLRIKVLNPHCLVRDVFVLDIEPMVISYFNIFVAA